MYADALVLEQALTDDSRLAIVVAAGNARTDNGHATAKISKGSKLKLHFMIWNDLRNLDFFCSYNAGIKLSGRVTNGINIDSGVHDLSLGGDVTVEENHRITFGVFAHHSLDPDRHFDIRIARVPRTRMENGVLKTVLGNIRKGLWTIELEVDPQSVMPTAFVHVWRTDPIYNVTATEFIPLPAQPTSPQDVARPASISGALRAHARQRRPESWIRGTLTCLAATRRAIVVGAYDATQDLPTVADFSSQGPDARNLMAGFYVDFPGKVTKPDIAAPGVSILTPDFHRPGPGPAQEIRTSHHGTSFSAPFVTGVVAMMWAAKPSLTNVQIKRLLLEAARGPVDPRLGDWLAHNPEAGKELWGAGVLDAFEAVKKAVEHP
jgi:subtilisin family serine protease